MAAKPLPQMASPLPPHNVRRFGSLLYFSNSPLAIILLIFLPPQNFRPKLHDEVLEESADQTALAGGKGGRTKLSWTRFLSSVGKKPDRQGGVGFFEK